MTTDVTMTVVIVTILGLTVLAYLAFVVLYDRMFPWRSSFQGRTLVQQKLTLAALAAFFIVDKFTLTGFWRDVVLILLLASVSTLAFATLFGLINIYRRARADKEDK